MKQKVSALCSAAFSRSWEGGKKEIEQPCEYEASSFKVKKNMNRSKYGFARRLSHKDCGLTLRRRKQRLCHLEEDVEDKDFKKRVTLQELEDGDNDKKDDDEKTLMRK